MKSKQERYQELLEKFKKFKFTDPNIENPFCLKGNFKQRNVMNPWELWYSDKDKPKIMFIGQDFSHTKFFEDTFNPKIGWVNDKTEHSVRKLFKNLLSEDIGLPEQNIKLPLFFTNAILGIKKGNKSTGIKSSWIIESSDFLRELIEIIEPRNIIVMGKTAYKSISLIYPIENKFKYINEAIQNNGKYTPKNIFVVSHCSNINTGRKFEQQEQDWKSIKSLLL